MITRESIGIQFSPGVDDIVAFANVGAVPALGVARRLEQGLDAVLLARIGADLEFVEFEIIDQVFDLNLRRIGARAAALK